MIRLLKQTSRYNCGAACLAMVLGLSSADAAEEMMGRRCADDTSHLYPDDPHMGVISAEMVRALFEHGLPAAMVQGRGIYDGTWIEKVYDILYIPKDPMVRRHVEAGGTAVLGVPSLNMPGYGHWIVVSKGEVYDPSNLKTYHTVEQALSGWERYGQAVLVGPAGEARAAA